MKQYSGFMHTRIRKCLKGISGRRKLRKLKRPTFINDAATVENKWSNYYALRDKHLALHFSSSLI